MNLQRSKTSLPADPLLVFERLVGRYDNCFLLETLGEAGPSYIGVQPERVYTEAEIRYEDLHKMLPKAGPKTTGYVGGLVGFTSHEAIQQWEPTLDFKYQRNFHDFQFGEYRDGLIFQADQSPEYFYYDQDRRTLYESGSSVKTELRMTYDKADKEQSSYEAMITQAKEDIKAGRVFQVVLANRYSYEFSGNLLELYKRLRGINPSQYMFFVKFENVIILGASPELMLHVTPERVVYLEALAGTIRRGKDPAEDEQLGETLLHDEKEIAEHSMLVDLARNDVGRVSNIGSVEVEKLMYLKRLSHVQHICSLVRGQLAADQAMLSALASAAPAGTLTGTPKIEAVKMIRELEQFERGPYGGTVGYFSYGGDSVHAVNIRSVSAVGNQLFMHSGSGIVYDSQPTKEFQEISEKKAAMDRAMEPFLETES